ncbi:MAG: hypothetical protein DI585_01545 [Pseudomonas fluorescens]|nr:MAG: hypothetical protein DI585_01545 [Pseudomonas fluorescens]
MHTLIMTENLFDMQQILRREAQIGDAPVRVEFTRRLNERLSEAQGARERVLRVNGRAVVEDTGVYDAIVVDMVLPLVEDVPVFIWQCVKNLKPEGLLMATTLGLDSFREFRQAWADVGEATGHVIPLTDVREAGGLLQKFQLDLPVIDRDVVTVTFADFPALYKSLRAHGVGNFSTRRRKGLMTPRKMAAMEEAYRARFGRPDGRIPVTVEIIYMHGFTHKALPDNAAKRNKGTVSLVRITGNTE